MFIKRSLRLNLLNNFLFKLDTDIKQNQNKACYYLHYIKNAMTPRGCGKFGPDLRYVHLELQPDAFNYQSFFIEGGGASEHWNERQISQTAY